MATVAASITSGSSRKTTDAYSPNPLFVNVGDTIVWTNEDSTVHTVTSGVNVEPDGNFDSSGGGKTYLAPQQTFGHTFAEEGEYPYYCALHPNMVGVVIVKRVETERQKKIESSKRVFISYSTKDRSLADKLYNELRDRDFAVWIDRVEIRPGDSLSYKIRQGITTSDALLVLVTRNSIKSTWVQREVRLAISREKKSGGPRVIPLVLEPSRIPKNLKAKLYVSITRNNLKLPEILSALYPNSYILRINLKKQDLTVDEESIRTGLHEYYRQSKHDIRVYIDNHNFNTKILAVIKKSLEDKEVPELGIHQIKSGGESLPVTLPIFWTSLSTIIQQLVTDLFADADHDLGTLETAIDSVIATMEYSLSALGHEYGYTVFPSYAVSLRYYDIAEFMRRHKRNDWLDFIRERHSLDRGQHMGPVDLIGKPGIMSTRAWTPPLSVQDKLDLQGSGLRVSISPVGNSWYSKYLPQIIGRELKIIALRRGKLLQKGDYVIGLHMKDYERAGLG